MIIPIFFPIFRNYGSQYDCDDDKNHGEGCECLDCKEEKKWANKPKEYFEYRYAIPKKWRRKNILMKIIRTIIIIFGIGVIFKGFDFSHTHSILISSLFLILGLGIIFFVGLYMMEKFIKYDFQCDDKIKLEKKYSESWETLIEKNNITKKYYLTKPEQDWKYK